MPDPADHVAFVRANTAIASPPLVPEIRLHLASEITPLWHATEASLAREQLPPPYWAFAWVGGQALARHILDHPALMRGRTALDFGAGSGLAAIAAARAGAQVTAAEIDPLAAAAIHLNAALNDVEIPIERADLIGCEPARPWEIVLAGDMCYERPLAERLVQWLRALAARGATVLLGDPGRAYLPAVGLESLARYEVPTTLELEDRLSRDGIVWRMTL